MPAKSAKHSLGFTLIEIMVVVSILAVVSSAAMLSIAGVSARTDKAQAQLVLQKVQRAWRWSDLVDSSTRLRFSDTGIHFENWNSGRWQASRARGLADIANLQSGASFAIERGLTPDSELIFLPDGTYQPFRVRLQGGSYSLVVEGNGYQQPQLVE